MSLAPQRCPSRLRANAAMRKADAEIALFWTCQMRLRRFLMTTLLLSATAFAGYAGYLGTINDDGGGTSVCRGGVANGRLQNGRRLPLSGTNYHSYSWLLFHAGRTFVHSAVRDAMRDAYAHLERAHPDLRFIYGETGWPWGGNFAPHKTHRNGTSVDFFVPVRDLEGHITDLSISPLNGFGYLINFDRKARSGARRIDFDAMALHLLALDDAAKARKIGISRVIFDVDLQPLLFASEHGADVRRRLHFNSSQAWVRHDQHYHVDFDVPCR